MNKCPWCDKTTAHKVVRLPGNPYDDWYECEECGKHFLAAYLR